jgi:catechol 2,3-dioxygenase-like lactoylglutathione lyase family enzyme
MITVEDITWVRYSAPDLDLMAEFLTDFGMHRVPSKEDKLFMRAHGAMPVVHVTERGPAGQIGFGLKARSRADLEKIASEQGASIEARTEPGGGEVVRLMDPDGTRLEIVHGFDSHDDLATRAPFGFNPKHGRVRHNGTIRVKTEPSFVQRLGHVALFTGRFAEMKSFYMDVLGMRVSDEYFVGTSDNVMATFLHCGLNDEFVDHHTVALIGNGRTGFEHCAFEVTDLDDLMSGNAYLISRNRWTHSWGIGRHVEGSQIFDYWRDPFGNKIEHWTDGDLVNDQYAASSTEFNPMKSLSQWGPGVTQDFLDP